MDKFLFLGTHTAFVTPKRIMKYMSYRDIIFNSLSSFLPRRQRFTLVESMIHSIRIDMRVQLHCIVRICVVYLKEVDLLTPLIEGLVPTVHHGRRDSLSRDH
ncbi:hypothetical protein RND81_03G036300 [Saponaria officinalis]|uniref:Uncharacterized protein n=1 Tax=Saponaria officinalis TaxID=3572 RepID=A0AAW1M2B8_SAPOF